MLPGDPEVPRGGVEGLMAQEHLDRPDIDAGFEQVVRKAVSQRMDTLAVCDLRAQLRMIGIFRAVPIGTAGGDCGP